MMAGGIGLDPDAVAFLTAAGITDATITTAIDTLVIQLKAIGVWNKLKAIYPFVGGTATTHKFNLKNPADTNAAFRLVFSGGWTHSANGALPNGTNAQANTFLAPIPFLTENSTHLSFYSRTSIVAGQVEIGIIMGARLSMQLSYSGEFASHNYLDWVSARVFVANTDTLGFFVATRTAINSHKAFKNGVQFGATNTNNPGSMASLTNPIYLASSGGAFWSSKQCAFASIGDGLTDTESINFYTAVQAFQTTLGRQV